MRAGVRAAAKWGAVRVLARCWKRQQHGGGGGGGGGSSSSSSSSSSERASE